MTVYCNRTYNIYININQSIHKTIRYVDKYIDIWKIWQVKI